MTRFPALLAIAGALVASPVLAAKPAQPPTDCFADLQRGTSPEIACEFPLQPNAAERAELEKQSHGYVKDVRCTVAIRIPRALVLEAVHTADYVFAAPEQPVQCTVTAYLSAKAGTTVLPISATFAPKVTIRDGKAIDGTPGLDNVKGVPRVLSWPVETWVNSGVGIKGSMLLVINAWLQHMGRGMSGRQALR